MAMRAVHRVALVRLRSGATTSAGIKRGLRICTIRSFASSAQHLTSTESEKAEACENAPSVLERSIGKDIAALEAIREAHAAGSVLDKAFRQCADRLAQCVRNNQRIFVTGMGKSGIVARRLASSLASVSVSSQWVHGGEWVHGELGGLSAGDVVIILSHSGNTSELVSLPKRFQDAGCYVVSVVGDAVSQLAKASDCVLVIEAQDDSACPVPSRSIVAQEALCNALIEYLIDSMDEAATKLRQSHPGGAIGRLYQAVDP